MDNHGWHYCYPPTFAILLVPLADPYPFLPQDGYLPFAVSVAIWYVFGVACVGLRGPRLGGGGAAGRGPRVAAVVVRPHGAGVRLRRRDRATRSAAGR